MEKKFNLSKQIFYTLFAFCFLFTGLFALSKNDDNRAYAEDVSSQQITNENLPDYFSVVETRGGVGTSVIDSDTFLFQDNSLTISFLQGNGNDQSADDRYRWVYYPDPENITTFYFYTIETVGFSINGVDQDITDKDLEPSNGLSFKNKPAETLEGFKVEFVEEATTTSQISLKDENGNLKEGLYTISITYYEHTCFDGGTTGDEENFGDPVLKNLTYSFYVADEISFLTNGRPTVSRSNFDHEVSVTSLTNPESAYYLYSNYSQTNIPYIEYDYTRFELSIEKNLSNIKTSQKLLYDKDSSSVISQGEDLVTTKIRTNNKSRVYFTDVGDYTLTLNAIQIVNFKLEGETYETRKYDLSSLTAITKKINVFVYGYQSNYTDHDGQLDENNMMPYSELKTYDFENAVYTSGADLTGRFLESDTNYSQDNYNKTFLMENIIKFIEDNNITPVVTNQTPISFESNATLLQNNIEAQSYIYSTRTALPYTESSYSLNGTRLYRTPFEGRADGTDGTYLYVIGYTYKNYYTTETSNQKDKNFYQVFYFEINKNLPKVEITTDAGANVSIDTFTNRNVRLVDTTANHPFNQDVRIQIYAWDYNTNSFYSSFGGERGISYNDLLIEGNDHVLLETNAKYTVRLYFENEATDSNLLHSSNTGFFRESIFTIDKTNIQNIRANNYEEISNSTDYRFVSNINGYSTNQSMAIAWDEKNSGANTFAYYRYFPIIDSQYYTKSEAVLSNLLDKMLNASSTNSYLPINSILDMSTDNNKWLPYNTNTLDNTKVSTESVFSDAGLYLIDVYDEAGNHNIELFILDDTTPIFAIYDTMKYSIPSASLYINSNTTLHWAKYKALYIANFDTISLLNNTPDDVTSDLLIGMNLFETKLGEISTQIYEKLYELFENNFMQYLNNGISFSTEDGVSELITTGNYNGYYITVPIESVSYFRDLNNPLYTLQKDVYKQTFTAEEEMTYSVLIRDASNTVYDLNYDIEMPIQYTSFYSARQTIKVSFDSSKFVIQYGDDNTELSSNYMTKDSTMVGTDEHPTLTTYLSPSNLDTAFSVSFVPTIIEGDITIQVDSIMVYYYAYIEETFLAENGIKYHYYTLDTNRVPIEIYKYNGNNASTEKQSEYIRLDSKNFTPAGKYVISRTYNLEDGHTYNKKDYYTRTYDFYVDKNGVISNADLVSNTNGDKTTSHLESLVGGDIFISMYDNKVNTDLVVTFPNSPDGNSTGSSLYNNGTVIRPVLTTNMLPVYIYVPQYKYTTYSQKVESEVDGEVTAYDFEVNFDTKDAFGNIITQNINNYYDNESGKLVVPEYCLFAEIFRANLGGSFEDSTLYANSSTDYNNIASHNGFLTFYKKSDGLKLDYLKEEGTYFVKLYQGYSGYGLDVDFQQSTIFAFDLKPSNPDFNVQTLEGSTLNSVMAGSVQNYYTNQTNLNLTWEAGSDFIAEIDIDQIVFKTRSQTIITNSDYNKNLVFVKTPSEENGYYLSEISLEKLGIYSNEGWVEITMQFKNHNEEFYRTITKRITVDLSAPSANVQRLVEKSTSSGLISALNNDSLRVYNTVKMQEVRNGDLNNTCYNISNSTGLFAYYSYTVTNSYYTTLKNSLNISNTDASNIYYRLVEDKYSEGKRETSPNEFLASNFTALGSTNPFEANSYYEIIEMDRAGNMSIYTIYVVDYTIDTDLFSYSNADGDQAYTLQDYQLARSYPTPVHNIYSKTGFSLKEINYFGDEWAQIQLNSYNVKQGIYTTKYLMLRPWDTENAYAFTGNEYVTIPIRDLIDGTVSTNRKNSFSIFNRENQTYDVFYFNIRNTTLTAYLTDSQNREYIRFTAPQDSDIQNDTYATTYVTSLKIMANNQNIYNATNPLGYASLWTSNDNINVSVDGTLITFEVKPELNFEANTRIIYEYVDNYGTTYKEIHLYRETIITQEVASTNTLYSYYNVSDGQLYYLTKNGLQFRYNPNKYTVKLFDVISGVISEKLEYATATNSTDPTYPGIRILTINSARPTGETYDDTFVLQIYDYEDEENLVKEIYFKLYYELPQANTTINENLAGQFKILDTNGNNITEKIITQTNLDGYYSQIRILYKNNEEQFLPIKYLISTDKQNWEEIASGRIINCETVELQKYYLKIWYDEAYMRDVLGIANVVAPESQIFEFNLSAQTATYWIEKTLDGKTEIVEKSNSIFKTPSGTQYSNHYIVNVDYNNRSAVAIKTNKQQSIDVTLREDFEDPTSGIR